MTTLETRTTTLAQARRIMLPKTGTGEERGGAGTLLLGAVQAAVRGIPSGTLQPVCSRTAGVAFQPRSLLALLTCSYATGIYNSTEIEESMFRDAEFRRMCGGEFPGPKTLRAFRRHNREALEQCLAAVLRVVGEQNGVRRGELDLHEEAHARLETAIAMDRVD